MDTIQITDILRDNPVTRNFFAGCFAADQLPEIIINGRKTFFFITNILTSKERGMGHWLLIYIHRDSVLFFDSFGLHFKYYNSSYINNFLLQFKPDNVTIAVSHPLQAERSLVCGAYCIFISYHICNNYNLEKILNKFSKYSRNSNDRKVIIFLEKLTGTRNHCNKFICPTVTFHDMCKSKCNCR